MVEFKLNKRRFSHLNQVYLVQKSGILAPPLGMKKNSMFSQIKNLNSIIYNQLANDL